MSKMDELRLFQGKLREFRRWLSPRTEYAVDETGSTTSEQMIPGGTFLNDGRSSSYTWTLDMNAVPREVQDALRERLQEMLLAEIEVISVSIMARKQEAAAEEARAVLSELGAAEP